MKIDNITAQEIIASGGYPTVQAKVTLENGQAGTASVPYGASAGKREAAVLTDNDESRYHGKGMLKAVANINDKIFPVLKGKSANNQQEIDQAMIELDGTENKSNLGGNAILAVSLAAAKAAAKTTNQPLYEYIRQTYQISSPMNLPSPMLVAIEGGKHASNTTDLQEYCMTAVAQESPTGAIRKVLESYHQLKKVLQNNNLSTNVGNEGAFAPENIASNEAPFNFIIEAIEQAGYQPGQDIGISIDAAASEFYQDGQYQLKLENRTLSATELSDYYADWLSKYPIATLEDMFAEDDWQAWIDFLPIAKQHQVPHIGDDLLVTSQALLQEAINKQAVSGVLIKLNQIGTLSETVATCQLAKKHQLIIVPSHRGGGETNDTSMVDLAVAVGAEYIKVGPTRGERVAKYNRLMAIERQLN